MIITIIGRICSGKNYFCNKFISDSVKVIEIGDIVREITQSENRVYDTSLDQRIVSKLIYYNELLLVLDSYPYFYG